MALNKDGFEPGALVDIADVQRLKRAQAASGKAKVEAKPAKDKPEPVDEGEASGFSDDDLRDYIEIETGERPHHKTGRAKLVKQFNELSD